MPALESQALDLPVPRPLAGRDGRIDALDDRPPPRGRSPAGPLGLHDEPDTTTFDHDRTPMLGGVQELRELLSGLRRAVSLHMYIVQPLQGQSLA
jgi:hypothetical protein